MPRPRKPTAILSLEGRFRKNPARGRAREDEPVENEPLGGPSSHLRATEREIWVSVQKTLVDGVALESDRHSFELMVRLVSAMQGGTIDPKEIGHLIRLFALFGMTPADRSRVSAPKSRGKTVNPFKKLG